MNYKKPCVALSILALSLVSVYPLGASPCPSGVPLSLAYIYRDRNRCEGTKPRSVGQYFDLIAFSTGGFTDYSQTIKIRVPNSQVPPNLTVQSYVNNYLLDNLSLQSTPSHYTFNLDPQVVLKKARIPLNSLRAIATVRKDSEDIYYPVIFNQANKYYDLTFYSSTSRAFPQVEIRRQGKVFPSNLKPTKIPREGEIFWRWEYGNAPAGIYELYLKDDQGEERSFLLEHDPKWLK